ncbi:hemolysin family protein [Intrasporangium calvum]|uniref:Hemolysin family protein n=1 Tax=Intrasporangium calvum TaxID=53358 RepID=A0ABT5GC14_9MICO|nr:hemolysin family protein [Intrasporangium calvum]MDC5695758.1 hemolysin family protein [Intrasporangium calvum]
MFPQLVIPAVVSIVIAFLLSAAEAAIFRMSRVRALELYEEGRSGAKSLVKVVAESPPYVSVIAFLRVVAEATTAVLVTLAVARAIDSTLQALLLSIAIMAVVSFVVVGVSPRTLGRQNFESVALWSAPFAVGLHRILGPLARLLVVLGNAVTPGKGYRDGPFQTESELRDLLDMAGESEVIEADEREMIHSVFELGDTVARAVMVPRTDMVVIEHDKTLRSAMSLFLRSGFSRIPVVGEDTDDILGLLYFKDVARRLNAAPEDAKHPATEVMRPMHFVPESKPVDDLLREMQRDQTHFAIVVDEYGGTAGLITIEDIIEEIVGEIADEHDREAPGIEELEDGTLRVPASMDIDDLAELFDVTIDEDDVDTVGGLLTKVIGRVPIVGSSGTVAGLSLTAERMAGRRHRVASVIVHRVATDEPDAPAHETEEAHGHATH